MIGAGGVDANPHPVYLYHFQRMWILAFRIVGGGIANRAAGF